MSNWIKRKNTKVVNVGNVPVGGGNPISIQSMTNTDTKDVVSTIKQIKNLELAGADIVRVSVPGFEEAQAFKEIKKGADIPLVADIHFDYKIALEVADTADCLRINPGNIGKENRVKEVINSAIDNNIPIRVGVNAGSLEKDLQKKINQIKTDSLEPGQKKPKNSILYKYFECFSDATKIKMYGEYFNDGMGWGD